MTNSILRTVSKMKSRFHASLLVKAGKSSQSEKKIKNISFQLKSAFSTLILHSVQCSQVGHDIFQKSPKYSIAFRCKTHLIFDSWFVRNVIALKEAPSFTRQY